MCAQCPHTRGNRKSPISGSNTPSAINTRVATGRPMVNRSRLHCEQIGLRPLELNHSMAFLRSSSVAMKRLFGTSYPLGVVLLRDTLVQQTTATRLSILYDSSALRCKTSTRVD